MKQTNTKRTIAVIMLLIIGGALYAYLHAPTKITINELTTSGSVTLTTSPTPIQSLLNQELTLDIIAEVASDRITAVQLELLYDPTKLQVIRLAKTDYLPNILATPNIGSGKVTATFGAPLDSGGRANRGTIGKLTIKPLAEGTQTITFGSSTLASAINTDANALKSAAPITITVNNPDNHTENQGGASGKASPTTSPTTKVSPMSATSTDAGETKVLSSPTESSFLTRMFAHWQAILMSWQKFFLNLRHNLSR